MQKLPIKISLDDSFFEPEELCGHYVTRQSKQHWAVILDLMVEFDRVCKEHGITYFLDSGTLLGAVILCTVLDAEPFCHWLATFRTNSYMLQFQIVNKWFHVAVFYHIVSHKLTYVLL